MRKQSYVANQWGRRLHKTTSKITDDQFKQMPALFFNDLLEQRHL